MPSIPETVRDPILITGAFGQDGSLLAERLASEGRRVIGLVRPERCGSPAVCELLPFPAESPAVLIELIRHLQPGCIFHVAAVHHASDVSPAAARALWPAMTRVNFEATTLFLQAILSHVPACRLVYAASSHMYRPGETHRAITEDSPRDPPSWYGLTKSWSMDAIGFARRHHGVHASTAILFNHKSPRRLESFISRKISRTVAQIRLGQAGRLSIRNIGAAADWCDAGDAVDALIRMAAAEAPGDLVVGSGQLFRVQDLVEAAFAAAGLSPPYPVDHEQNETRPALYADTTRIRRTLGWLPRTSLPALIGRMVEADLARLQTRHSCVPDGREDSKP